MPESWPTTHALREGITTFGELHDMRHSECQTHLYQIILGKEAFLARHTIESIDMSAPALKEPNSFDIQARSPLMMAQPFQQGRSRLIEAPAWHIPQTIQRKLLPSGTLISYELHACESIGVEHRRT